MRFSLSLSLLVMTSSNARAAGGGGGAERRVEMEMTTSRWTVEIWAGFRVYVPQMADSDTNEVLLIALLFLTVDRIVKTDEAQRKFHGNAFQLHRGRVNLLKNYSWS